MAFPPFWLRDTSTITWKQHAVGQGGFHSGHMVHKDGADFNWIFDCGSASSTRFDDYLRPWVDRLNGSVDWLFISHFDSDHVSGLDTLMSRCAVMDVMVPYVDDVELVCVLLHEIGRGNLQRSIVDLVADPAAFFLSRGARRVTFLNGGDPGDAGEGGPPEPLADPDDSEGKKGEPGWDLRIDKKITSWQGPAWHQTDPGISSVGTIEGGTCAITISRPSIGIRLKPYRAPIAKHAHQQLLQEVRTLVRSAHTSPAGRPGLRGLAYVVAQYARTRLGRAELQALHKRHAGSSNRASLSLLSEPSDQHGLWRFDHTLHWPRRGAKIAWVNTGDAELLAPSDLADWRNCYSSHLPHVGALALPHHGSDRNSGVDLQNLCPNAILIAHAKSTSRKHPGATVASAAGRRLLSVSENGASAISMLFCRP